MSAGCSSELRFLFLRRVGWWKGGRSVFFHLFQPASALHPCNQTLLLWAGTCRREIDTFVTQKGGPHSVTTMISRYEVKIAAGLVHVFHETLGGSSRAHDLLELKASKETQQKSHFLQYLETHTLFMSVPAQRSRTSSVTSRFGGISECCVGAYFCLIRASLHS